MNSQTLASSIYVYNYLTNIFVCSNREELKDAPLCWGYDSIFEQVCVINSTVEMKQLALIGEEITNRCARKKRIITTLSPNDVEKMLPGFDFLSSKKLFYYKKPRKVNTAGMVSEPILDPQVIARHDGFKNAYISGDWGALIAQGLAEVWSIQRKPSNLLVAFVITCQLKRMAIIELVVNTSFPTEFNISYAINTILNDIGIMNKPLIVIAGKDISMCMPESKFKQLAAISYFEQTVYGTRVASVPLTLASAVLLSNDEYKHSLETLHSLGLPAHNDLPKNWDTLAALSQIINHPLVRKKSPILDAGGEYYSVFLHHLALLGFTDLYCVNLAFTEQQKKNGIRYSPGDITKTLFPDNFFAAIACLSVIEHGVDPGSFFSEMNRIIMPGGILFISVDYWQTKIKTEGKISYGAPIKIFCRDEINDIIKIAQKYDFALAEPINLRCRQKVVQCDGFKYTFLYLTFIKQLN